MIGIEEIHKLVGIIIFLIETFSEANVNAQLQLLFLRLKAV